MVLFQRIFHFDLIIHVYMAFRALFTQSDWLFDWIDFPVWRHSTTNKKKNLIQLVGMGNGMVYFDNEILANSIRRFLSVYL